jgi:hypothetical protein
MNLSHDLEQLNVVNALAAVVPPVRARLLVVEPKARELDQVRVASSIIRVEICRIFDAFRSSAVSLTFEE